jgi:hypothetical protein
LNSHFSKVCFSSTSLVRVFFSPVLPGVKAANQVVEAASATKTTPMKLKKVPEKLVRGQRTHAASFALFAAF